MAKPLISVIIATYGREKYIRKTLESILSQSYDLLEIIVIDDSESDKTEKIVELLDRKEIKYIKSRDRLGFVKSLNKGIKVAAGKYIARLDDDDFWSDPKKIRETSWIFRRKSGLCIGWGRGDIDRRKRERAKKIFAAGKRRQDQRTDAPRLFIRPFHGRF